MLFNSIEFILVFLPATIILYWMSSRWFNFGKLVLILASLAFYAWWSPKMMLMLLGLSLINYLFGSYLISMGDRANKLALPTAICINLGVLGLFKYFNFFVENANLLGADIQVLHIALPLGISFFTFQKIGFLVDARRGLIAKRPSFLDFTLFVFFFPQLIAGPIVHHKDVMPQFQEQRNHLLNAENVASGLFLFVIGMFKKTVIADTLAIWADTGYAHDGILGAFVAWQVSLAYTLQLYFDFSGYSDMAIGLGLIFNIRLPTNFFSPYKSLSIRDFWRRWHITLGRFLRDYVYIPFGGNRDGRTRTAFNLVATFALGGLWHGASWLFVLWGVLHGLGLVIERLWGLQKIRLPKVLAWALTFLFVHVAWVLFRSPDMATAVKVLRGMFGLAGTQSPWPWVNPSLSGVTIAVSLIAAVTLPNSLQLLERFRARKVEIAFSAVAAMISLLLLDRSDTFLYWNF